MGGMRYVALGFTIAFLWTRHRQDTRYLAQAAADNATLRCKVAVLSKLHRDAVDAADCDILGMLEDAGVDWIEPAAVALEQAQAAKPRCGCSCHASLIGCDHCWRTPPLGTARELGGLS